jgi:hypothetical protein
VGRVNRPKNKTQGTFESHEENLIAFKLNYAHLLWEHPSLCLKNRRYFGLHDFYTLHMALTNVLPPYVGSSHRENLFFEILEAIDR